jgi:non-specific serine/threonine protein kinase
LTETVADYLRRRTLLIVLDNCEHLLRVCTHLVDALLRTSPNLCVLATSREMLGINGELIYRVPSLSVPDLKRLPPPDALTQYEAVEL